jgi:rhamnosyltransferase
VHPPAIAAVVPVFRPDGEELHSLVSALVSAGVPVLVSDDASPCTVDPALREAATLGASVQRHVHNAGIARGLNDGLRFAEERGARWLLTIDQDSAIPTSYVSAILAAAEAANAAVGSDRVGAIAPGSVDDESGEFGYPITEADGLPTTEEVIQTGTLWSVSGLRAIGGFDESFGIDAVDAAACVRLRAAGRLIVLVPELSLAHRLGDARRVSLLGRTVLATGHSPERHTTIVRNRLRLAPEEFAQSPTHAFRTLRRVAVNTALAVTVEEDRWAKAKASARGLFPRRDR